MTGGFSAEFLQQAIWPLRGSSKNPIEEVRATHAPPITARNSCRSLWLGHSDPPIPGRARRLVPDRQVE